MVGAEYGGFDWAWLLNNLEVEKLTIGGDGEQVPVEVEGLILGSKGLQAAEGYLLGRFHLYTQVYMHKTTRSAEKMLGALLGRVSDILQTDEPEKAGLPINNPLRKYFGEKGNTLGNFLDLDDATVWGGLPFLESAGDELIAELARRLRNRELYKCLDVGALAEMVGGDVTGKFRKLLSDADLDPYDVLLDRSTVSPYKFREYESPDALAKIMIRLPDGSGHHEDVTNRSRVIRALGERRFFRVYGRTPRIMDQVTEIWKGATQ